VNYIQPVDFRGEALERAHKRLGMSPGDGKMSDPPPYGIITGANFTPETRPLPETNPPSETNHALLEMIFPRYKKIRKERITLFNTANNLGSNGANAHVIIEYDGE
jgi:hypothetical protein